MDNNRTIRLLRRRTLVASEEGEPVSCGDGRTIEAQIRVIKAGTDGSVVLKTAVFDESGGYCTLGTNVSLLTTCNNVQSHSSHLDWVKFTTSAATAGEPLVEITLQLKG